MVRDDGFARLVAGRQKLAFVAGSEAVVGLAATALGLGERVKGLAAALPDLVEGLSSRIDAVVTEVGDDEVEVWLLGSRTTSVDRSAFCVWNYY